MSGRSIRTALLSCLAGAMILAFVPSGVANAAQSTPAPAAAGKYCLTEVAPAAPGSRELKEVSTTCSATAKPGTVLPDNAGSTAALQPLVIFHQDANYGGAYDTVSGRFGPCDSAGYGFSNLSVTESNVHGISSYLLAGGSNCHVADYWTGTNYTGAARFGYRGNNPYVGGPWNDNLYSMKVRA